MFRPHNLIPVREDLLVGRPEARQSIHAQSKCLLGTNVSVTPDYVRVVGSLGDSVIEQTCLCDLSLEVRVGGELEKGFKCLAITEIHLLLIFPLH